MHPKKQDVLNTLDDVARIHDASFKRSIDVIAHPEEHGWRKSILTAAVVVPLTGISAVLTDLSRIAVARSDDDAWNRQLPLASDAEPSATETPPDD